jgi:hypothetical protein
VSIRAMAEFGTHLSREASKKGSSGSSIPFDIVITVREQAGEAPERIDYELLTRAVP